MSTAPPPAEDPDEQYRHASALDASRPSEATRHAVLSYAARLAAGRARADARRRWLSFAGITSGWRPALAGTLAAAVLAGVLIAPQLLTLRPSPPSESKSAAGAASSALSPAVAQPPAALQSAPGATAPAAAAAERPVAAVHPRRAAPPAAAADTAINRAVDLGVMGAMAGARAAPAMSPVPFDAQALRRAAGMGDLVTLSAQLAAAGDLDARDAQGRTALLLATLRGQEAAVAALLAHGANPNAVDAQGTTPLAAALVAGEPGIATLLRHYGAR
jgi:anti-sigma-K factor RskA